MIFQTQNPTTGEKLKEYRYCSDAELEVLLDKAQSAFLYWQQQKINKRKDFVLSVAKELSLRKDVLATLMATEMGKPIFEGRQEIDKCVATCEYYYETMEKFLLSESVIAHYPDTKIVFKPLGVLFAIMPWNYPVWQLIRFAVPAIASGNVVVMKHSDITAGVAKEIESLFQSAGESVLFNCSITHEQAARVIADRRVSGVTFTGSTESGKKVAEISARNLKKTVLELGGNDPYLVLDQADLSLAAKVCAQARLVNNGQSCIAAKRLIVVEHLVEDFLYLLVNEVKKFKIGNPLNQEVQLGPLAHGRFKQKLEAQIAKFLAANGEVVWQAKEQVFSDKSAFLPPKIIYHENNCPVLCEEEVFGPVFNVIAVRNNDDAVRVANYSPWGLGAAVFTQDKEMGRDIIENKLNCGMAVLNDQVKSDPRVPFGGVRDSGFGRELSRYGMLEFVNIKSLGIR